MNKLIKELSQVNMCVCNRISFSLRKEKERLLFVTMWMNPEGANDEWKLEQKGIHCVISLM